MTKSIRTESDAPTYQAKWVAAFRGTFRIYDDRVEWNKHTVSSTEIRDAVVYATRQWFIPASVLQITTDDGTWQFGFNPWARFEKHLPFSFRREKIRLRYSPFSIALRVVLAILVGRWLYKIFIS